MRQLVTRNETTGAVIAQETSIAESWWPRFRGLMMHGPLAEGEALLINPCSSVHMFFMRIPLDIVFLDKENRVVKIISSLKQWRIALGGKGAHSALEMAAGSATGVSVGDKLVFEPA